MSRAFLWYLVLKEAYNLDRQECRRHARHIRHQPLLNLGEDYETQFRLTKSMVDELVKEIKHLMLKRKTTRGLTIRTKLLCALSFLASGNYQRAAGRSLNTSISQPSISRSLDEISRVLSHPDIVKKYICFPQTFIGRLKLQEQFHEKYGIPNVLGCIKGTYVAIIRPRENSEKFLCPNGYYARNVILITDANLNILHVDCSYGSSSDNYIFNNSSMKPYLEHLTKSGETAYLLGDSNYPLLPNLMTPIPDTKAATSEAHYNILHATAHARASCAIMALKGRFRCLLAHKALHYNPDVAARIIIASCVLHNICNKAGLSAPVLSDDEATVENDLQERSCDDSGFDDFDVGRKARSELVSVLWCRRSEARH